jgi:hypothetical protein
MLYVVVSTFVIIKGAVNMNSGIDLQNIATTMSKLNYDLSQKMQSDNEALIELADEMAERATTFGGQGYKAFLESRERFTSALHRINDEYRELIYLTNSKS